MVLVKLYLETLAERASDLVSQLWPSRSIADIEPTRAEYIVGMNDGRYPTPPVNTTLPVLNVEAAVLTDVVQCSQGIWTGTVDQYLYKWKADGVDIPSAVTAQHTVTVGDQGKTLTCAVTARNEDGEVTVLSSNACIVAGAMADASRRKH